MKNITKQQPTDPLYGRTRFSTSFVDVSDIAGKHCLDIGCGYGWMELALKKKGASSVLGTELHASDLITTKKFIHSDDIKFRVGSAIKLPINDHTFDTVISWEVIEHIPKGTEPAMFREVRRVLKPHGTFYLSTPYHSIARLFDPAYWLIGHRHYTKSTLIRLAGENGFKVEKCEVRGGWWELLWLLNLYGSKWILHRRPFAERFFERRQDQEFASQSGFTNIFLKLKRVL
jgi:2-polyprenyl-3-methyl-5-hydroxy-6-metoxy-1,4-benzoquinol methylase